MRIPRIYTQNNLSIHESVLLEGKAHKHLKDVLRMKTGDSIILFNGNGNDYKSTIKEITKKSLIADIHEAHLKKNESPLDLHLLQPLCSAEKMDLCIQKATELGANKITPFISTRVNINITKNRLEKKMLHWHSVIQSACEQSGRAKLPVIHTPIPFNDCISNHANAEVKLIASPFTNTQDAFENKSASTCVCAIGPEGGFTEQEIDHAVELGFKHFQMGERILRLETAVISTITLCQINWGDFQ